MLVPLMGGDKHQVAGTRDLQTTAHTRGRHHAVLNRTIPPKYADQIEGSIAHPIPAKEQAKRREAQWAADQIGFTFLR